MKETLEETEKSIREIERSLDNISHNQLLLRNWKHLRNAIEKKLVMEKCKKNEERDGKSA
ncbi:MAG: hypothetical protein V2I97_15370 [Desulfococcaceae bacterium]|jgi:hypothetical protein|nr:hypothetical protein [Desulfococcaceae bacterium]